MSESYSVEAVLSARDAGFIAGMEHANKAAGSLGKTIKSGLGFGVLAGIGGKAVSAVTKGLSSIASHTDAAVKRVDTLNNFPKIMKNLGYSTKDANKAITKMSDGIDGLPTALDSIAGATQKIAPLTGSLSKATDVTLALNNALLAGGKSTEIQSNALEQFSQMLSVGKVDMAAWRSMVTAMPGQMDQLSQSLLGAKAKNMDLYEAMKSGEITFDQFNDALLKLNKEGLKSGGKQFASFADQAKDSSKGIQTSMTNVSTAITKGLANVIQSGNKLLERLGLPGISDALDMVKDKVNTTFKAITGYMDGINTGNIDNLIGKAKEAGAAVIAFGVASKAFGFYNQNAELLAIGTDKVKSAIKEVPTLMTRLQVGAAKTGITMKKMVPDGLSKALGTIGKELKASTIDAAGNAVKSSKAYNVMADGYTNAMFKFQTVTGRFDKNQGLLWKTLGKTQTAFGKLGSGVMTVSGQLAGGLQTMMSIAMKALLPAALIGAVVAGLGVLYQQFGTQIDQILAMVQAKGPQIISNLVSGITGALPSLIASGAQMLSGLLDTISSLAPNLIQGGVDIVAALVSGLGSALPTLLPSAINMVGTVVTGILGAIPRLLRVGMQFLVQLSAGIASNIPLLISKAKEAISGFIQGISSNLPSILQSAVMIVQNLVNGIVQNLPSLISTGISLIIQLGQAIISNLPTIIQSGVQVVASLAMGIVQAIPQVLSAVLNGVGQIITTITSTNWFEVGLNLAKAIGTGILNGLGPVGKKIASFFHIDTDWGGSGKKGGADVVKGTKEGITSNSGTVINTMGTVGIQASNALNKNLKSGANNAAASFNLISNKANSLKAPFANVGNSAKVVATSLEQAGNKGKTSLAALNNSLIQTAKTAQKAGKQAGDGFSKNLQAGLKKGVNYAKTSGQQTGAGFVNALRSALTAANAVASSAVSSVSSVLRGGYGAAYSAGAHIGQGVASGLRSALGSVTAAANAIVVQANRAMRAKAQIHSPSKLTKKKVGKPLVQGVGVALKKYTKIVAINAKDFIKKISGSLVKETKKKNVSPIKGMLSYAIDDMRSISSKAKTYAKKAGKQLKTMTSALKGGYKNAGTSISKTIKTNLTGQQTSALKKAKTKIQSFTDQMYGSDKLKKQIQKNKDTIKSNRLKISDYQLANSKLKNVTSANKQIKANQKRIRKLQKANKKASSSSRKSNNAEIKRLQAQNAKLSKSNKKITKKSAEAQIKTNNKKILALKKANNKLTRNGTKLNKKLTKQQKLSDKMYSTVYSQYESYLKSETDKVVSATEASITAITEKYQAMYDAVIQKRTNFYNKLASVGELFTADNYGYIALKDFKAATAQIKAYSTNVEKLKKILPDGFMEEILGSMDTSQGLQYTNRLLQMSTSELKKYGQEYTSFINAASQTADKYYNPQLSAIKKQFDSAIDVEMSSLQTKMDAIGQSAVQGFMDGISKKSAALKAAVKQMSSTATKAASTKKTAKTAKKTGKNTQTGYAKGVKKTSKKAAKATSKAAAISTKAAKKKLKVHSPSRVFMGIARNVGIGYIKGLDSMRRLVRNVSMEMINIPSADSPRLAYAGGGLNDNYAYGGAKYEITVVSEIDGREFARATAEPMQEELDKRNKRNNRKNGNR